MKRKAKKWCGFGVLLFVLCTVPVCQVRADWKEEGVQVSTESFYLGELEEEIEADVTSEDDTLYLTVDTTGKKEGYYTATFLKELEIENDNTGILLEVKNQNSGQANMNVICINQDYDALVVRDDADIVLKTKNTYSRQTVKDGAMVIPASYDGEIYIPFDAFSLSGSTKQENIEEIRGIGFTLVAPEEKVIDLEIDDIFLTQCTEENETSLAYLLLEGDATVLKPTMGDSIVQYHAAAYNIAGEELKNVSVRYEIADCEGVTIDGNSGLLTVNKDAIPEALMIRAIAKDGSVAEKEVNLEVSWTTTQKTENGYDASLASPDEVADILEKSSFLTEEVLIMAIRMILILSLVIFIIYYLYQRNKVKRQGGI